MQELDSKEITEINGGIVPMIILADIAVGATLGSLAKKLWNKYV